MSNVRMDAKGFRDYLNQEKVRWCPGCGNHGILRTMTKAFADLDLNPSKVAVISGIGCSSRLPYYLNTYGFHTLHGRAPTVATGLKLARPDLSVWVVTGDGDCLAIGGNHFIHLARRNLDINVVIFNNAIYGLTKGQASPTTAAHTITKSTPYGVEEPTLNPLSLAISAGASFVARTIDTHLDHMQEVFRAAYQHPGTSIIEVLVNCIIFNDGVYDDLENQATFPDTVIALSSERGLIFGKDSNRALCFDPYLNASACTQAECDPTEWQAMIQQHYDSSQKQWALAMSTLDPEHLPTAIGVLYQNKNAVHSSHINHQPQSEEPFDLQALLNGQSKS